MNNEDDAAHESNDNHVYNSIFVYKETFDLLLKSLHFYRDLLRRAIDAVNVDDDLKALLDPDALQSSPAQKELKKVENAIKWWEQLREREGADAFDYNIGSFSHGAIRFLKSVACLYLRHLRYKRDVFSNRPGESKYVLESLDNALSRFEEKMRSSGVFGKASTIPLLVEDVINEHAVATKAEPAPQQIPAVEFKQPEGKPVLLETIQILDPMLRDRCLDLFNDFDQKSQHDRFDTVIAEATRVLEDRLRCALGVNSGTGDDLANKAFGSVSPKLRVSTVASEQNAVLLFFKAIFGHVRNPSHHKLLGNLSPERTIQILAMVDYAIHLLETAERISD
ncbi:MAG: hypothetical protein V7609_3425 [Verrucomicrobiota bacterium]